MNVFDPAYNLALHSMKTQAIRADKAVQCCEIEVAKVTGNISSMITQILEVDYNAGQDGAQLALALAPGTAPRIIQISELGLGSAVVGAIVLATATELIQLAQDLGRTQILSVIITAIGQYLAYRDSGCLLCIESKTWPQSNPRLYTHRPCRSRK